MARMIVNSNLKNLTVQETLRKANQQSSQSLERLASGLRINRSADDPAAQAISTGLRAMIRGLRRAVQNTDDALNAIDTAQGAVGSQTEVLQRIRELAVQAGGNLLSFRNLEQIQIEIDQQIRELQRVGSTTEYNGKSLINGTFINIEIQVGPRAGQTIDLNIGDLRATNMGGVAKAAGNALDLSPNTGFTPDVKINGVAISTPIEDGVSEPTLAKYSSIAKANAINDLSGRTGVQATVGETVLAGGVITDGANAFTGAGTESLAVNGVTIVALNETLAMTNDGSALINRINQFTGQTGVVASAGAAPDTIELRAADGRNIVVDQQGATLAQTGFAAVQGSAALSAAATNQAAAAITLTSVGDIQIEVGHVDQIGFDNGTVVKVDSTKTVSTIDVTLPGGPTDALWIVDAALDAVALGQAELGSIAKRLENTIDGLQIAFENATASNSRIRDTDYARGMANLTRSQIVRETGLAILAQANIAPQAVLSLLQ